MTDPLGRTLRLRWLVIIPPAALYFFSYFQRIAPAVVAEDLLRAFAIPAAALGTLAAILSVGSALFGLAPLLGPALTGRLLVGLEASLLLGVAAALWHPIEQKYIYLFRIVGLNS